MTAQGDDYRIHGQEKYLQGATLRWSDWTLKDPDWDHDHCEFCWAKFTDQDWLDVLHSGYTNGYHWICKTCFEDFKDRFEWQIETQA